MKTKQLVKRFIEAENKETTILQIITEMGTEFQTIQKARSVKTDRGLIPIFKDMDKKYRSFVFKVNTHYGEKLLKSDMFEIWLKAIYPVVYIFYKETNRLT